MCVTTKATHISLFTGSNSNENSITSANLVLIWKYLAVTN